MPSQLLNIIIIIFLACNSILSQIPYTLLQPDRQYNLPIILNEISGLTDLDIEHLAIVQDEQGLIFIFHLPTGEIIRQFPFDSIGDFEGLSYTGKSLFILRSDGRLTEWKGFDPKKGGGEIIQHELSLQTKDNEGLCYDDQHNQLLIAAKSKPEDPEAKTNRYIYSYNLSTGQLTDHIQYTINTEQLSRLAAQYEIPQKELNGTGKPKPFNFRPSSLAIHPFTHEIYILSAADQLLLVINEQGIVVGMESLDHGLFAKAEGITFLSDGTMLISNEAAGGVATVLKYNIKE